VELYKIESSIMADSSLQPSHSNNASFSDRLVKIEVLLEQVLSELTKGNTKFEKIEIQFEKVHARISELEKELSTRMLPIERQQSYWQGGLALVAIIWTLVLKYMP
jgi:hypothetical protein